MSKQLRKDLYYMKDTLGVYKEKKGKTGPCKTCSTITDQILNFGPPQGPIYFCDSCLDNLFPKQVRVKPI